MFDLTIFLSKIRVFCSLESDYLVSLSVKVVESKKIVFLFMGGKSGQALQRYRKLPWDVDSVGSGFYPEKL